MLYFISFSFYFETNVNHSFETTKNITEKFAFIFHFLTFPSLKGIIYGYDSTSVCFLRLKNTPGDMPVTCLNTRLKWFGVLKPAS